jgi:endonuclease YncB( thermonuclease family)
VDGDTVDLMVDLGFYVAMQRRFRLLGLNAPEVNAADPAVRAAAAQAKAALVNLISGPSVAGQLRVRSAKDAGDKYGRYLGTLLVVDSTGTEVLNVNDALLKGGYAVAYNP